MDAEASKPLPAFGFLTVLEDPDHGFFGGYLVLSELGRPLEFHCSTPVQPNQAQIILYGATLRSYVLGELIGQTLVAKAQLPVHVVLTDLKEMMTLALIRTETLVCVEDNTESKTERKPEDNSDAFSPPINASQPRPTVPELVLGTHRLKGTSTSTWHPETLSSVLSPLIAHIDLCEPFERIREAIREAQRLSAPPGDEAHESSAA